MMRALKTKVKHLVSPKYAYLRRFNVGAGDVVIDLGANVGEVSEYFLNCGAKVEAYEPNPHALSVLKARHAHRKNLNIHAKAVSNFAGTSKLWLHEAHGEGEVLYSQASSLRAEKGNLCKDFVEVEVADIKAVLDAQDKIRLIKIDIEGGEYDIMDEILAQADKIDFVLLETHEKKNQAFQKKNDELLQKIEASGQKAKIFTDWF